MAVKPEILLDAAQAIGRGDLEVDWRNATSRAYYAAFHRCRLAAQDANLSIGKTGGAHKNLVDALMDSLNPRSLWSLGYILEQCRILRVVADYGIDLDFPRDKADLVLALCERILRQADTLWRSMSLRQA